MIINLPLFLVSGQQPMIDSGFQLTVRQKRIRDGLKAIDEKIASVYEGAYRVLTDPANPDRYAQSANSLREVTSLLSRLKGFPQEKMSRKRVKQRRKREQNDRQTQEEVLPRGW